MKDNKIMSLLIFRVQRKVKVCVTLQIKIKD